MCNKQITVMKKQFFRMATVLTLVLGGAFAFSGCTDYEEDINAINDRIDQLEAGQIADVGEQLTSLSGAVDEAKDLINTLDGTVDGLSGKVDDLETLTEGLDQLKADVEAIDLSIYETAAHAEATYATLAAVKDIETDLGDIQGKLDNFLTDADIADFIKASDVEKKIDDAIDAFSATLGDTYALKSALQQYATVAALDEKLDIADFDTKVKEAIDAALANGGQISGDIQTAITNATKTLQDQIDAILNKIEDLANRIQSLVFVPEYNDGCATGVSYTLLGEPVGKNIVKATFQVSPKEYAANLVAQPENVVANIVSVATRAAGKPEVATTENGKLDIRAVDGLTAENGYVEVVLYTEKAAGTYAFSLYVASAEEVEEATENPDAVADFDAGTYISSEYVQTATDSKFNGELSDLYSLRDSEKKEIDADALNARVEWARLTRDESTLVDFYAGYELYINLDGDNYYTIAEAAEIIGAETVELTPKYAAGEPSYTEASITVQEGKEVITDVPSTEIAEYFTIADAAEHNGKTVEMAGTADEMSAIAGAMVSIDNTFYFGEKADDDNTVVKNTTTYRVINEPIVITINAPKTEWTYEWALDHAFEYSGTLYPNRQGVEYTGLDYEVEGDLGSNSLADILNSVYMKGATLNGTAMENTPLVQFGYDSDKDNVNVTVYTGYAFSDTEENNYAVTYVKENELVDYTVNINYAFGVMPGDITVDLGEVNIPVFSLGGAVEDLGDAFAKTFTALANGAAWFTDAETLAKSMPEDATAISVVRTSGETETEIEDPEWTYLRIAPYKNAADAEAAHLRISSSVVKSVDDVFEFETEYETWYGVTYTYTAKATITAPEYTLAFNPAFVSPEGNVTLKYHEENGVYVLNEADPKNYFYVTGIPADFAEKLSVKFNVTSPDKLENVPAIADAEVTVPAGTVNAMPIDWSTFEGRDLTVEAVLLLGESKIEVGSATINITSDPIVTGFEGAQDATIERESDEVTVIDLWDYLSATGIKGNGNFLAEGVRNANLTLYGASVTFGELKATINGEAYEGIGDTISYDAGAGTITVDNDNATLQDILFEVPVELSYYLDDNQPIKSSVKVTISQK